MNGLRIGYLVLYLGLLVAALPSLRRQQRDARRDADTVVEVQGRVVAVEDRFEPSSGEGFSSMYFRPRVAYRGPSGELHEQGTQEWSTSKAWHPGWVIPVWVDPQQPTRVWARRPTRRGARQPYVNAFIAVTMVFVIGGLLLHGAGIL